MGLRLLITFWALALLLPNESEAAWKVAPKNPFQTAFRRLSSSEPVPKASFCSKAHPLFGALALGTLPAVQENAKRLSAEKCSTLFALKAPLGDSTGEKV